MNYVFRPLPLVIAITVLGASQASAQSPMGPVETIQAPAQNETHDEAGQEKRRVVETLLPPLANPATEPMQSDQADEQEQNRLALERISRYGKILQRKLMAGTPFTAWVVEKNGTKLTLYTTPSADTIFAGLVWDGASGQDITPTYAPDVILAQASQTTSDSALENALPAFTQPKPSPSEATHASASNEPVAALDGWFTGEIPASMKAVDSLAGFKEGNGGIADTLYVIVDPRCPYCRKAFNLTREYVKKGRTIKWIPALALGHDENALGLAANILQSNNIETIERVLGRHEKIKAQAAPETREALAINLDFMFAAFKQNKVEAAGVPVAFFLDHRTGKARMMTGVSEPVVLEEIFGKI